MPVTSKPKHEEVAPILRPFTTNYSGTGLYNGHARTYEGAVKAIVRNLVERGVTYATVEDPTKARKEAVIARIRKTKEGFNVYAPQLGTTTVIKRKPELKRVK